MAKKEDLEGALEAFGELLDLLPKSKKAMAFPVASQVELAVRWAIVAHRLLSAMQANGKVYAGLPDALRQGLENALEK